MNRIVIIGDAGHSRSSIEVILESKEYEIVGALARAKPNTRTYVVGDIEIIGDDSMLPELYSQGIRYAFVALGSNEIRKRTINKVRDMGFVIPSIISKHAIVSDPTKIGDGSIIMPGAVIRIQATIGEGCIINTNASVDHDCVIDDYVHLAPGVAVSGSTHIGEGTFVGTNSAIIDKVDVGCWSCIGAGGSVVDNIADHVLACGVPAQIKKSINKNN